MILENSRGHVLTASAYSFILELSTVDSEGIHSPVKKFRLGTFLFFLQSSSLSRATCYAKPSSHARLNVFLTNINKVSSLDYL